MQQYFMVGNQFQNQMWTKFQIDVRSTSAAMSNVRGREELVYNYINETSSLFQSVRYASDNPMGLYSDYEAFQKHFVRYWSNALDISKTDKDGLRDIFDEETSSQESCKRQTVVSVFFENGKALTTDDCLNAVYEVLKIYR